MDYKEQVALIRGLAYEWNKCSHITKIGGMKLEEFLLLTATAITDLLARAAAEEARAEKAERERDAAVSDLETVMAYGGGNLDTCQFCKNGQCYARGGTKLCLPKWRGQKEE